MRKLILVLFLAAPVCASAAITIIGTPSSAGNGNGANVAVSAQVGTLPGDVTICGLYKENGDVVQTKNFTNLPIQFVAPAVFFYQMFVSVATSAWNGGLYQFTWTNSNWRSISCITYRGVDQRNFVVERGSSGWSTPSNVTSVTINRVYQNQYAGRIVAGAGDFAGGAWTAGTGSSPVLAVEVDFPDSGLFDGSLGPPGTYGPWTVNSSASASKTSQAYIIMDDRIRRR